ncbi:unnamed protein product, partial [Mesorhabditis belari]|uniref:Mediator complex subunit 15 n=1 Tax=Mesorhabditis belari TaxID=2138241 RepID=A0AAF3EB97_9BILA
MSYGGQPGDQYAMMRTGAPNQQPQPGMQQRMMMGGAPGGVQMIQPQRAAGPQTAMYGPNPNMIPPQNLQMQQQGYHMQQQQRIPINAMVSHLPPHQQQEVATIADPQQRMARIQQYFQQLQRQRMQQQQQQQMVMQRPMQPGPGQAHGNMMRPVAPMYPNGMPQQPAAQMPPMVSGQPPIQHQTMMQRIPSSSSMMGSSPMSMGQGSVPGMSGGTPNMQPGTPQQQQMQQVGPNTAVPSPKVASLQAGQMGVNATSPATQIIGQSPVASSQPKTPAQGQPPTNTPGSTGTTGNPGSQQQAMNEEENRIYKERINEMNRKYRDSLMRILDRAKLDREQPPAGTEKFAEILDEKRVVSLDFLDRLSSGMQKLIERNNPINFIMDAIKQRCQAEGSPSTSGELSEETKRLIDNLIDPWAPVKHLRIRVPDHVRAIYKKDAQPSKKRKADDDSEPVEVKRQRPNSESDSTEQKMTPSSQNQSMKVFPMPSYNSVYQENAGSVPCLFDLGKRWKLPEEAMRELSATGARWAVDKRPPCKETPDVQLCIESEELLTCPLRVLLPVGYPSIAPQVLFAESFPPSVTLSASLETFFRRRLALQSDKSLTSLILSWRAACEQQVAANRTPSIGSVSYPVPPKQLVA